MAQRERLIVTLKVSRKLKNKTRNWVKDSNSQPREQTPEQSKGTHA